MSLLPSAPKKAEQQYQKSKPKKGIGKDIYDVGQDIFGEKGLDTVGGWLAEAQDKTSFLDPIRNLFAEGTHPMGHPAGRGGGAATPTSPKSKQDKSKKSKTSSVSGAASDAVSTAEKYIGMPYVYGGDSPSTSFDCSGLVEYAYKQAGIALPRTSEAQWAFLSRKSVDLKKVQEGDIVFAAGSDGSADSPGHEALMISQRQIIEAPQTGSNIRIRAYNPGEWSHAGRPSGSLSGSSTASGKGAIPGTNKAHKYTGIASGNTGTGISSVSPVGNYGSVEEVEGLTAALAGGSAGIGYTGITGSSSAGTAGTDPSTAAAAAPAGTRKDQSTGKYTGKYGAGVKQWSSQVTAALKQLGLSASLLPLVLNQMQSESSGNPNVVNKTDSNWQAGHPSVGLMQVIQGTFDAYAGPYKSKGPFLYGVSVDPLANIYAALNYGKHGAGFGGGPGQIGSMHGYAKGGKDTPEGMKIVGERGPELIKTPKGTDILSNKQSMDLLKSVKRPAETAHSTLLQDIAHGLKSVEKAASGTLTQSQSANLASITASPSTTTYQTAARNLVLSTSTNVQRYGGQGGYGSAPMLNFKPNSIVIHNHSNSSGNGGASGDQQASLNAREMVKQVLKYLYNEQMYGAMVKGVKA